jgi:hypothetical protein
MKRPDVAADLIGAVVELSTAKPHVADDARYTRGTWPIYCEGYYAALNAAVKVLALAVRRRRLREHFRRQAAQAERRQHETGLVTAATPVSSPLPAPASRVVWFPRETRNFDRPAAHARLRRRSA